MGKIIERVNGVRIITVVFYTEDQKDSGVGYIDFVDDRYGKPRHRFAYINRKDWEREIIIPNGKNLNAYGRKKAIESQLGTIECMLNNALMEDKKLDIVVERRQVSPQQQFDYLVKVDDTPAFQG